MSVADLIDDELETTGHPVQYNGMCIAYHNVGGIKTCDVFELRNSLAAKQKLTTLYYHSCCLKELHLTF